VGIGGHLGLGLTRAQVIWSCLYWGVWIAVGFIAPEILGWDRLAPWVTLSETVGWVEHGRALLADLIFTFVLGVAVHWRFGTPFGRTEAVALALGGLLFLLRFAT
jgi:hypothetical protein